MEPPGAGCGDPQPISATGTGATLTTAADGLAAVEPRHSLCSPEDDQQLPHESRAALLGTEVLLGPHGTWGGAGDGLALLPYNSTYGTAADGSGFDSRYPAPDVAVGAYPQLFGGGGNGHMLPPAAASGGASGGRFIPTPFIPAAPHGQVQPGLLEPPGVQSGGAAAVAAVAPSGPSFGPLVPVSSAHRPAQLRAVNAGALGVSPGAQQAWAGLDPAAVAAAAAAEAARWVASGGCSNQAALSAAAAAPDGGAALMQLLAEQLHASGQGPAPAPPVPCAPLPGAFHGVGLLNGFGGSGAAAGAGLPPAMRAAAGFVSGGGGLAAGAWPQQSSVGGGAGAVNAAGGFGAYGPAGGGMSLMLQQGIAEPQPQSGPAGAGGSAAAQPAPPTAAGGIGASQQDPLFAAAARELDTFVNDPSKRLQDLAPKLARQSGQLEAAKKRLGSLLLALHARGEGQPLSAEAEAALAAAWSGPADWQPGQTGADLLVVRQGPGPLYIDTPERGPQPVLLGTDSTGVAWWLVTIYCKRCADCDRLYQHHRTRGREREAEGGPKATELTKTCAVLGHKYWKIRQLALAQPPPPDLAQQPLPGKVYTFPPHKKGGPKQPLLVFSQPPAAWLTVELAKGNATGDGAGAAVGGGAGAPSSTRRAAASGLGRSSSGSDAARSGPSTGGGSGAAAGSGLEGAAASRGAAGRAEQDGRASGPEDRASGAASGAPEAGAADTGRARAAEQEGSGAGPSRMRRTEGANDAATAARAREGADGGEGAALSSEERAQATADAKLASHTAAVFLVLGPPDLWKRFLVKLSGPDGAPSLSRVLRLCHGHPKGLGLLNMVLAEAIEAIALMPRKSEEQLRREVEAEGIETWADVLADLHDGAPDEVQAKWPVDAGGPKGLQLQHQIVAVFECLAGAWPERKEAFKQLLLQQDGKWQDTALHTCVRHGLLHVMEWLLPRCDPEVLAASTKAGWSAALTGARARQLGATVLYLTHIKAAGLLGRIVEVGGRELQASQLVLCDASSFVEFFERSKAGQRLERAVAEVWPDPADRPEVCSTAAASNAELNSGMVLLEAALAGLQLQRSG